MKPTPYISRCLLSSVAYVCFAAPVAAQELSYNLDPIIVENRDPLVGAADRATSMYVSDLELERARTGDLKDVFSGIASVSVGGALPLTQKIYLNGVDMLNLGVTIDGAAQNNRAFHHVSANAIDPGLLKQVRADATVAPADAGPYALAGSVVFKTVDPEDILADGDAFGGNFRTSFADNGSAVQSALTIAGRQGGFSWLGYAKSAVGDDYETGAGQVIGGTGADLQSYLAKIAFEAQSGHRVEVMTQQLDDSALRQYRANFGGPISPDETLRLYDTSRKTTSFSYSNTQASGFWDPTLTVGYSESDVRVPDPYDSNGLSSTFNATAQNRFNFADMGEVTAGLDWQDREGRYTSPTYDEDYSENSQNIGAFAQARLTPTDLWKVSFGARLDHQTFEGLDQTELTNTGVSGNASVVYALTDTLSLRGGASSVFGGIVLEDNYVFVPSWSYDDLDPARANNATIGFDWQAGGLLLSGEVFASHIDNARGVGASRNPENFDFESTGFNLGGTYDWTSGFARMTLSHSEVALDGERANSYESLDFGAPLGTIIAMELEQDTPVEGLRLGGGVDIALDYDLPDNAVDETVDLEGYTVVNAFVEYAPPQLGTLTLRADVSNLFDVDYADRATYGNDFASVTTLNEPGRTLSLTAVARF